MSYEDDSIPTDFFDDENEYGENVENEMEEKVLIDEKEITEEKSILLEKKKADSSKANSNKNTSFNIDIKDANDFLQELSYASIEMNNAAKKLEKIDGLNQVVNSIEKLKNIEIDTSKIEEKFDEHMIQLNSKASNIVEKLDFSELDEMNLKLSKISKKVKTFSYFRALLASISMFFLGVAATWFLEDFNTEMKTNHNFIKNLESKGFHFNIQKDGLRVIISPNDAKFKQREENSNSYYIYK